MQTLGLDFSNRAGLGSGSPRNMQTLGLDINNHAGLGLTPKPIQARARSLGARGLRNLLLLDDPQRVGFLLELLE